MSTTRYALEKTDTDNQPLYYISRTKWTEHLSQATLFQNPDNCRTEIQLLPDSETINNIHIRHIQLIPTKETKPAG